MGARRQIGRPRGNLPDGSTIESWIAVLDAAIAPARRHADESRCRVGARPPCPSQLLAKRSSLFSHLRISSRGDVQTDEHLADAVEVSVPSRKAMPSAACALG